MKNPAVCPHCHQYSAGPPPHVDPSAPTPRLEVGQEVIALRDTAVCRTGERGIVLREDYTSSGRPDWIIRFPRGGIDGWSPCEVGLMLRPVATNQVSQRQSGPTASETVGAEECGSRAMTKEDDQP